MHHTLWLGFLRRCVAASLVFVALLVQLFPLLFELLDLTIQLFPFAFEHLQLLLQGFELLLEVSAKDELFREAGAQRYRYPKRNLNGALG